MARSILSRLHTTAARLRPLDRARRVPTPQGKRLRPPTTPCKPRTSSTARQAIVAVGVAEPATSGHQASSWRTLAAGVGALALATAAATASSREETATVRCEPRRDSRAPTPHLGGPHLSIHDAFEITDEVIGEGGYCVVHRGVDKRTGEAVAVKVLDKRETPAREFWTEVDVLRTASHHPNIMQLRGVFESENRWYIVQELASEGELFDHLIENGAYSEKQASGAIRELCDALHYLHRKGIVHGDIKPENILLHNGHMCLVDFGVSFRVGEHFFADTQLTGTVAYAAPETLRSSNAATMAKLEESAVSPGEYGLGPQADMFALGVVLYILLCGSHPFDPYNNLTDDEIRQRIVKGKFSRQTRTWQSISPPARDLIEKLLEPDPDQRLTSAEAMQHSWLLKDAELSQEPIRNSAELLARFQRGRRRLRASILGVLLLDVLDGDESGDEQADGASTVRAPSDSITMGISSSVRALNQKADALLSTLDVFDREKKGFITKHDLARVSKKLGRQLSETELNEMLVGATGDPEHTDESINSIAYDDVKLAISTLRSASYDPGEVIIHEGQTGHHVFLLLDGEVEVSCKNPIKRVTEPLTPAPSAKNAGSGTNNRLGGLLAVKQLMKEPSLKKKKQPAPTAPVTPPPNEEVTLKRLKKGSFFGEIELLRPDGRLHPRIATYRCASTKSNGEAGLPCKVLQLVADDFLNVGNVYATINEKVESSARHHTQHQLIKCLEATKGSMKKRTLAPGEFVYHEGEQHDSFFLIVDGEVEVLRQHEQITVEQLKQGDYFPLGVSGMTSNCTIHNRHYSVRCTKPTTVIEVGGETFRSFLHSNQFMASYFRQEIKSREQLRLEKHTTKPLN